MTAALWTLLATQLPAPAVQGVVRLAGAAEPIPAVQVALVGGTARTRSDSSGAYVLYLTAGPPAPQQLSFSRLGFATLTVEVLVPEAGDVHLDVELEPAPIVLSTVQSLASPRVPPDPAPPTGPPDDRAEVGARRLEREELGAGRRAGEADVLRGLAFVPGIDMPGEFPMTLRARGGAADQNLFLVDGVPIYSPQHAGGGSSALNPDVVARVDVHTAVPPASYGGRLSDVIDVNTVRGGGSEIATRGAASLTAVREVVSGPLPFGAGGLLVSARRSYRDLLADGDLTEAPRFSDLFGKVSLDFPRDSIDMLVFRNDNALGFEPQNRFRWTSGTTALIWRHTFGRATRWETRVWRAGLHSDVDWVGTGVPTRLRSALDHPGLSTALSWRLGASRASAGLSVERLGTSYEVRAAVDSVPPAVPPFALAGARTLLGAFVEDRVRLGSRWALIAGLRGNRVSGRRLHFEPRMSLKFAATPALTFSAGYARLHQYVQSVRNEESIVDAVFGPDLPVGAGVGGVPVGQVDQVAATIAARLGPRIELSLDGYLRRLRGLVLVAPATSQPFATDRIPWGSGQARGLDVVFRYRGDRLDGQLRYTVGLVTRRQDTVAYQPAGDPRHALALALGYRATAGTTLEATFWAATGRPTTPFADGFDWQPYDALGGADEIVGSPERVPGPLNREWLPAYARLDLGVRRDWHVTGLGRTATLASFVTLCNVLNRRNAMAYVATPTASRPITMLPRSVSLGLEWQY